MYSHPATRQDEWVLDHSDGPGTYCEVGAFDGVTHSNTLALEEAGWRGLLIEPNPQMAKMMRVNRSHQNNHFASIGINVDEGYFDFIIGGQYSGLREYMPDQWVAEHLKRKNPMVRVPCKTLHGTLLSEVDYLSLDTEGSEYAILHDWFEIHNHPSAFRLLTVEFRYDQELLRNFRTLLEPRGYVLDEIRGFDLCFIRQP